MELFWNSLLEVAKQYPLIPIAIIVLGILNRLPRHKHKRF